MSRAVRIAGAGSAALLVGAVRLYQWVLRPVCGPACRFEPVCSEYAVAAIGAHGAIRGGALAIARIARCHPWGGCGHDPVPQPGAGRAPAPRTI